MKNIGSVFEDENFDLEVGDKFHCQYLIPTGKGSFEKMEMDVIYGGILSEDCRDYLVLAEKLEGESFKVDLYSPVEFENKIMFVKEYSEISGQFFKSSFKKTIDESFFEYLHNLKLKDFL